MSDDLKLVCCKELKYQEQALGQDTYLIVRKDKDITVLNPISKYLLQNCENKDLLELTKLLFEELVDKDNLRFEDVLNDCKKAVEEMMKVGIINYKGGKAEYGC